MMESSKKSMIFVYSMRFYKVPSFVQRYFYRYSWRMQKNEKSIYLTFDDGPNDLVTHQVLDILLLHNIKATFFCVGENITKFPEVMTRIVNEGHSIGNHTHNHIKGWISGNTHYIENVKECQNQLLQFKDTRLFRPPYGRILKSQADELLKLGFKIIMWDILSYDYDKNLNCKDSLGAITKKSRNGSIVVFHDSIKSSAQLHQILPFYIQNMKDRGFNFKTL